MDNIANENNQTIVFPVPMELIRKLKQIAMKNKKNAKIVNKKMLK